ncbi:unnamed protein product [Camellia sinensis]
MPSMQPDPKQIWLWKVDAETVSSGEEEHGRSGTGGRRSNPANFHQRGKNPHKEEKRFQDDLETPKSSSPLKKYSFSKLTKAIGKKKVHDSSMIKMVVDNKDTTTREPSKELTRVFSEDYDMVHRIILDPQGPAINRWNKCLFIACLVSLFIDPLFFFLPTVKDSACIGTSMKLKVALTTVRSMVDVMYMVQIIVWFRTAYVAPPSRVIGRGELVLDLSKIASTYVQRDFCLDLLAAVPIPQVSISTGVVMKTAWAGAAYNLMLFMMASHVIGQEECWKQACSLEGPNCEPWFFDCSRVDDPNRAAWLGSNNITNLCDSSGDFFQFGIYCDALNLGIVEIKFINKYYLLVLSMGGTQEPQPYRAESLHEHLRWRNKFCDCHCDSGIIVFCFAYWEYAKYLTSTNMKLERWRIRRNYTKQWMRHRQLPHELKESVRRYDHYKWVTTCGVDEEDILRSLPLDLRCEIKRHLCLDLVHKN